MENRDLVQLLTQRDRQKERHKQRPSRDTHTRTERQAQEYSPELQRQSAEKQRDSFLLWLLVRPFIARGEPRILENVTIFAQFHKVLRFLPIKSTDECCLLYAVMLLLFAYVCVGQSVFLGFVRLALTVSAIPQCHMMFCFVCPLRCVSFSCFSRLAAFSVLFPSPTQVSRSIPRTLLFISSLSRSVHVGCGHQCELVLCRGRL